MLFLTDIRCIFSLIPHMNSWITGMYVNCVQHLSYTGMHETDLIPLDEMTVHIFGTQIHLLYVVSDYTLSVIEPILMACLCLNVLNSLSGKSLMNVWSMVSKA